MKESFLKYLLLLQLFTLITACKTNQAAAENWIGSWACAQMLVEPNNMPPAPGLAENTLRQIIKVSIGGEHIRLRFSNVFSDQITEFRFLIFYLFLPNLHLFFQFFCIEGLKFSMGFSGLIYCFIFLNWKACLLSFSID